METKIKKAILDIVKGRIDRANYGMCSKYFVCTSSLYICESNNIHITKKLEYKDTITMNGVVIGEIRYRYAAQNVMECIKCLHRLFHIQIKFKYL